MHKKDTLYSIIFDILIVGGYLIQHNYKKYEKSNLINEIVFESSRIIIVFTEKCVNTPDFMAVGEFLA